ncbi:hypothetical protein L204_101862 [Cryptococcus depauperatus]
MESVHGNLSHAMRDNYNEYGVEEYYRKVAATYRNPFFPGIKKVVWELMNKWWDQEGMSMYSGNDETKGRKPLKVLDMAAGSGEATLCLLEWAQIGCREVSLSHSSQTLYSAPDPLALLRFNPQSNQPSRPAFIPQNIRKPMVPSQMNQSTRNKNGGSGMLPRRLPERFKIDIVATDPYTSSAYTGRTGRSCYPMSFTELAQGQLPPAALDEDNSNNPEAPIWDIIICSFALHLVTNPSELFALLYELSGKAKWLIVVAPHKKPEIKENWGWSRWNLSTWSAAGEVSLYGGGIEESEDGTALEIVRDKVKLRLYRSNAYQSYRDERDYCLSS